MEKVQEKLLVRILIDPKNYERDLASARSRFFAAFVATKAGTGEGKDADFAKALEREARVGEEGGVILSLEEAPFLLELVRIGRFLDVTISTERNDVGAEIDLVSRIYEHFHREGLGLVTSSFWVSSRKE